MRNIPIDKWKKEEKMVFRGWDFSHIKRRYTEDTPNWNYSSLARGFAKKSNSILDIATGGGEVLSKIIPNTKAVKIIAIEGYKPNVSVAAKKLSTLGVKVLYANEMKKYPFSNDEFDLILNRHGGLNVKEISRVISSNGIFLTQQVDGRNLKDLMKEFKAKPKWEFNTLKNAKRLLIKYGFEIEDAKEWKGRTIFKDVSALVYFLKAIPWIVDDFSVERDYKTLIRLHDIIEKKGELSFSSSRFLVIAKKI